MTEFEIPKPKKGLGLVVEPSARIDVYVDNSKTSAAAAAADAVIADRAAANLAKIAKRTTRG